MINLEGLTRREFLERTLKGAAGIAASTSSLSLLGACASSELTKESTEQDILNALKWIEFGKVTGYEKNPHGIPVQMPEDAFPIASDYQASMTPSGLRRTMGEARHTGIDFQSPVGTPVIASADGYVMRSEYYQTGGWNIVLRHTQMGSHRQNQQPAFRNDNLKTYYGHLRENYVKSGQFVKAGQVIGASGNTGTHTDTIPHVHFEVWEHPNPHQQYAYKNPHKYWIDGPGKVTLFDRQKNVYERNPLGLVHPLPGRKDVLYFFGQMKSLRKVN